MDNDKTLTVLVEFEIRPENNSMSQWLAVWKDRGDDALFGEPETSAYEAAVSQENPNQVLIFERYTTGLSGIKVHTERPAHATLTQVMGERNMTRRRVMANQYRDIPDYGWWDRSDGKPMRDEDVIITIIGTRFEDDAARDRYIEVTGEHARYCYEAEPDTLVYNGAIALQDAERGPNVRAGDLVFVAAFRNEQAVIKHRDDPRHLALQPVLEQINRERMFALTYRSTGAGFLWK